MTGHDFIAASGAAVLIEAGPSDYRTGGPGLAYLRSALSGGLDAIVISKGALVRNGRELRGLAKGSGSMLRIAARPARPCRRSTCWSAVCWAHTVLSVEGILNATTNYLLDAMTTRGIGFEEGCARRRRAVSRRPIRATTRKAGIRPRNSCSRQFRSRPRSGDGGSRRHGDRSGDAGADGGMAAARGSFPSSWAASSGKRQYAPRSASGPTARTIRSPRSRARTRRSASPPTPWARPSRRRRNGTAGYRSGRLEGSGAYPDRTPQRPPRRMMESDRWRNALSKASGTSTSRTSAIPRRHCARPARLKRTDVAASPTARQSTSLAATSRD